MLSIQFEVFFEVAKNLSFSKAAQALFVSQPAVSKHIKQLEGNFKISLFERRGNTIALTPSGKILYQHMAKAKAIQKQMEFEMSSLHSEWDSRGFLNLGASTTVSLYIIPKILSAFHQKHPHIQIQLVNRNSQNILKALLEGEIDVGIIEGQNRLSTATYQYFTQDNIIAVCSTQSPYASQKVAVQDLKNIPLALRERGSGTLAALVKALSQKDIKTSDLNVKVRLGGTEALKNFLVEDICVGFLPSRSVVKELALGILSKVELKDLDISRKFFFINRPGEGELGLVKRFMRFAKNLI